MGLRMLQGRYLSVLEAKTADNFKREIIGFAESLGFTIVNAAAVIDHSLTHTEFLGVNNVPSNYQAIYDDERLASVDPVMQHCKRTAIPIAWDQNTYLEHDQGEKWEHQAQFGYKAGIALALHLPGNKHFLIGINGDRPLPSKYKKLTSILADMQLFSVHAQEAAFNIFLPQAHGFDERNILTPRELECIRWTMDGYTAADIGERLNISERTAVFHLQNAMKKLSCRSKYQAVLKAMRLGLLT